LTPLSQYITATFVTPDYFDNIIAYTTQQGLMEESEAREYFSLSNYMVQSLIAASVLGIVTTAIVAFFVKKEEK